MNRSGRTPAILWYKKTCYEALDFYLTFLSRFYCRQLPTNKYNRCAALLESHRGVYKPLHSNFHDLILYRTPESIENTEKSSRNINPKINPILTQKFQMKRKVCISIQNVHNSLKDIKPSSALKYQRIRKEPPFTDGS